MFHQLAVKARGAELAQVGRLGIGKPLSWISRDHLRTELEKIETKIEMVIPRHILNQLIR